MARRTNLRSKLVAWMKILLPLAALGLLSTLFLLSRTIDPTKSIAVSQIDIEKRAQEQGASNPTFAGVTDSDDQIVVRAQSAIPDKDDMSLMHASGVDATLALKSGAVIDITAQGADVDSDAFKAQLNGNVRVVTSNGYNFGTDVLNSRFDILYADTPGPVSGTGPPGVLDAGRMVLTSDEQTGDAHLLFTDGVKLIYHPQNSED